MVGLCFFLSFMDLLRKSYHALFEGGDEQSDSDSSRRFSEKFGWFTIIERVGEIHRLNYYEVMRMRGDIFINTWAYIDGKNKLEKQMMNEIRNGVR